MAKANKGARPADTEATPTPADAARLVEALTRALPADPPPRYDVRTSPQGKAVFATRGEVRTAVVLALLPAVTGAYAAQREAQREADAVASPEDERYEARYDALFAARGRMARLHKLLTELLRGKLRFTPADADALFGWVAEQPADHFLYLPDEPLVRLAEQLAGQGVPWTARAHRGLRALRKSLRKISTVPHERLVEKIDRILAKPTVKLPAKPTASTNRAAGAPAGAADGRAVEAEADRLVAALPGSWPMDHQYRFKPEQTPAGKALLAADPAVRRAAFLRLLPCLRTPRGRVFDYPGVLRSQLGVYSRVYLRDVLAAMLRAKLPFTPDDAERFFSTVAESSDVTNWSQPLAGLVALAEQLKQAGGLSDGARRSLARVGEKLRAGGGDAYADSRRLVARLSAVLEDEREEALTCVAAGEAWSDRALADHGAMPAKARRAWGALLRHAAGATAASPAERWTARAAELLKDVGGDEFAARVVEWFPLVERPRTAPWPRQYARTDRTDLLIADANADVLRGLAWTCAPLPSPPADVCRALGRLCETSLKKLPGIGPRLPKLANAAVYALGRIGGEAALGQLARLKTRVTFRTTLQQIEKALDEAATRLGVTKADLEELGVPAYGFDLAGVRRETFDDGTVCELRLDGRKVVTTWTNAKGKPVKSPPAGVKAGHSEVLKELKLAAADAEKMLTAQRDRIDSLMGVPKTWKLAEFRERYLEHPLVGQIARRLIWMADGVPVLFDGDDARASDVAGRAVKLGRTAEVGLWHPAQQTPGDVLAWRRRLEDLRLTQPFKQAHREVYLLTDAERRTRTYSNRFAGHVLRQHQFHALAAQRGWRNRLRLMVDDSYPPATKELRAFGLRAEYWVEGIGDDYGTDTTDSGAYLRVVTDQVRFYRIGAATNLAHAGGGGYASRAYGPGGGGVNEPLPLEQIPPLALSEVMRDVDLFVGVTSVGNDPTWQDGGPGGRYRNYWQSYSFGELSETARTRRAVLESLVPRLTRVRDRLSLAERFLVVRGDLRTYKIHLGSGNILMEPNDQYLCIVPDRSPSSARGSTSAAGDVFLPFEGDATLSVILSKAFLLAADAKISDPTITRQIKGG